LVVAWKEVQTFEVGTARNLEEQKKIDVRKLEEKISFLGQVSDRQTLCLAERKSNAHELIN